MMHIGFAVQDLCAKAHRRVRLTLYGSNLDNTMTRVFSQMKRAPGEGAREELVLQARSGGCRSCQAMSATVAT